MPLKLSKGQSKPPVTTGSQTPKKRPLLVSKGATPVRSVNSVSSKGKLTLKNTATVEKPVEDRPRLKLLSASIRKADLEKKKAATVRRRTQHQDELDTPLASIDRLEEYVRVQLVTLPNGKQREWPVISPTAAADPLLTTPVTISRWISKGQLPAPIFEAGRGLCYHLNELRSFCEVLGQHFTETKHYRANNTETKKLLFDENLRIRNSLLDQAV